MDTEVSGPDSMRQGTANTGQAAAVFKEGGVRLRQFSPVGSSRLSMSSLLMRLQPRNGLVDLAAVR